MERAGNAGDTWRRGALYECGSILGVHTPTANLEPWKWLSPHFPPPTPVWVLPFSTHNTDGPVVVFSPCTLACSAPNPEVCQIALRELADPACKSPGVPLATTGSLPPLSCRRPPTWTRSFIKACPPPLPHSRSPPLFLSRISDLPARPRAILLPSAKHQHQPSSTRKSPVHW